MLHTMPHKPMKLTCFIPRGAYQLVVFGIFFHITVWGSYLLGFFGVTLPKIFIYYKLIFSLSLYIYIYIPRHCMNIVYLCIITYMSVQWIMT